MGWPRFDPSRIDGDSRATRRLPFVALSLALALVLVGCSGGDDDSDSDPGDRPELAATPEFCVAASDLIGSMESVGVADPRVPAEIELAYTSTVDGLDELAGLAPNAGVANQIGETTGLFLPLVEMLSEADWDVAAIDAERAEELEILQERSGPELDRLTGEFEQYVSEQCAIDVDQARSNGVERFYDTLIERAGDGGGDVPVSDDDDDQGSGDQDEGDGGEGATAAGSGPRPGDRELIDEARIGDRGGQVFCAADRLWLAAIGDTDRADEITIIDPVLALAAVSTDWGERLPVELATTTVDLNVGFAEVVAAFAETQDGAATLEEYRRWRTSPAFADGRAAVDAWVAENCD